MVLLKEYKEFLESDIMKHEKSAKKTLKILKMFATGKYKTKEIADEVKTTQRYVQIVIGFIDEYRKYGRTRDVPIFTVLDLLYIAENPDKIEEVIERKYLDFHKRTVKRDLKRSSTSKSHIVKRAKLRADILDRDNYTCTKCGSHVALEIHHIKKVSDYEHLEFDKDNCITLCHECHER